MRYTIGLLSMVLSCVPVCRLAAVETSSGQGWPPAMPGAVSGTVTLTTGQFLDIPEAVVLAAASNGAAPFVMAATPPTVELAFHGPLPDRALNGTGWSAWGDIAVAADGQVYCGIGDHGKDTAGESRAYLYQWDPETKVLKQVADVNTIVPRRHGEPTWAKMHARIDEGRDGRIYFSATLNAGNRAGLPACKWSEAIPGGQLYRYDPRSGEASVVANLPSARVTATSLLDRERNRWWCNLEGGSNALYSVDLSTMQTDYRAPDGSMAFNRNFALARDGSVYFNGHGGIWTWDARKGDIHPTRSAFPGDGVVGMRASAPESRDGWIYGVTMRPGRLFRYSPEQDKLEILGPDFLGGDYTVVCVLSPDERFLYYLPGAHGSAVRLGTPVVQYDIANGRRKVLAFLQPALESAFGYVPAGTYGVKLSSDGGTLYVNFNGHAADSIRPVEMRPIGFGLTAFAAIHIPEGER